MSLTKPFNAVRPTPEHAASVIAPPYDVVTVPQARALAKDNSYSFLHVSRGEIDLSDDISPYDEQVYQRSRDNFISLLEKGILRRDDIASYYLYRLSTSDHQQTGLVAGLSVDAYLNNRIRKHELTRPMKEDDRVAHMEALSANVSPVMLSYQDNIELANLYQEITKQAPTQSVVAADGVEHSIWEIVDRQWLEAVTTCFDQMPAIYIADGHHRVAAAARVAQERRKRVAVDKDNGCDQFLGVLFPSSEVQILGYHRLIKDLNGLSVDDFLSELSEQFKVELSAEPVQPSIAFQYGMYLSGQWYTLEYDCSDYRRSDPLASLDVSIISDCVIAPILGIDDQRRDERVAFVGGHQAIDELTARVDSGEMQVAFALYPTSIEQLFAVTQTGDIMPPKSTWFEPKLADGLLSFMF